jgi:alcohol dehydrogenase (cytochrome c)
VCPGFAGATNWYSPSYSEITHLFYFKALEDCGKFFLKPQQFSVGREYYSTGVKHITGEKAETLLLAFDVNTETFIWRYPQISSERSFGGTMTTAGGLLFFGDDAESFEAVDAHTGKPMWHFLTGQRMDASPMSYAVRGKQYVAIAAGSDIFSFALP